MRTTINVKRLGLATGATLAVLYLGCAIILMSVGRETAVWFGNSLLHGLDVSGIVRTQMSWPEMLMGLVEIFVIGWLAGATLASIYNLGNKGE